MPQERRLQSYQDYLVRWDDHESRVMSHFEDADVERHGSLEKAEMK